MIDGELSLAVGGQSVADMFRRLGRQTFNRTLRQLAPDAPPARIWGFTRGGTVAASTNVSPTRQGLPDRYWWDLATDAPSPALLERLENVGAMAEQPCDCLIWDLGQFEAGSLRGKHGRDPDAAREDYRHAMFRVLQHIRERLSPSNPEDLPILLMPHAPHPAEEKGGGIGVKRVRAVQYELIAAIPNCHDAGIVRDMEMKDNMHPSREGIQRYAESLATTFSRTVLPHLGIASSLVSSAGAA